MPLIRRSPPDATPPSAAPDLLAALGADGPDERWMAARALADVPDGAAALGRALRSEADPRVREAILTSLTRVRTTESVEAILPHLRSDDAAIRNAALDALRAMADVVGSQLPALLGDTDPDIRLLACEIARALPATEAAPRLCGLLEVESHVNVCAAAVEVLMEIGDAEALPTLARCEARFSREPFLVFAIRAARGRLGSSPLTPSS